VAVFRFASRQRTITGHGRTGFRLVQDCVPGYAISQFCPRDATRSAGSRQVATLARGYPPLNSRTQGQHRNLAIRIASLKSLPLLLRVPKACRRLYVIFRDFIRRQGSFRRFRCLGERDREDALYICLGINTNKPARAAGR